ncbi:hypothetical protein DFR33_107221 [Bradymonas sediminis]|uniref:Uncharacterized protein n=1 Tax=Bradymonas sediminis TaxID=1548548 RepID=A0A2Z4FN37_9DELT|nr:hypothetical protein DN745_13990 [Bradymonas sediminis]TDP72237.1 hypothetical protein DFR33_107221 [Bradymonas sediminis]
MNIGTIRNKVLRPLFIGFQRDEDGAALTEMVMTLPIWILMLGGIISLGRLGMNTTSNQLDVQTGLWDGVFEVSATDDSPGSGDSSSDPQWVHFTPISGGAAAAYESGTLAGMSQNPNQIIDGVNSATMGAMAVTGTLGESYGRTLPLQVVPGHTMPDVTTDPDDVLQVGSPYPKKVTYDGVLNSSTDYNTGGGWLSTVTNAIGNVVASAGMVGSLGAGIRYGEVYTESNYDTDVMFNVTIPASAHANILVAPKPMTGNDAKWRPFLMNRLLAGGEENYSKMMRFGGDPSWDAEGSPDTGDFDADELDADTINDKADEIKEQNAEGGG